MNILLFTAMASRSNGFMHSTVAKHRWRYIDFALLQSSTNQTRYWETEKRIIIVETAMFVTLRTILWIRREAAPCVYLFWRTFLHLSYWITAERKATLTNWFL